LNPGDDQSAGEHHRDQDADDGPEDPAATAKKIVPPSTTPEITVRIVVAV